MFGFLKRRREVESAVPGGGAESLTRQLKGDGTPIGQQVDGVGQPTLDFSNLASIGGMASFMGQAMQFGNVQPGQVQAVNLEGMQELQKRMMQTLQAHGIDPDNPASTEWDAADLPALRAEIIQAMKDAGIDPEQQAGGQQPGAGQA